MNFTIEEQYLTDVTIRSDFTPWANRSELTPDELVEALGNSSVATLISTIDHPEFTKLRERLNTDGYINIQRSWWNGDTVLKPFTLNGYKFKKNNRFPCAAALGVSLKVAKKYGRKTLEL